MVQVWVMVLLPYTQNHGYSITSNEVYAHAGVLGQGDVGRIGVVSGGGLQKYQVFYQVLPGILPDFYLVFTKFSPRFQIPGSPDFQ